jgi:uncharacterized protein (DUF488 family)
MAGILTIGHSTLSQSAFLELVRSAGVEELWDVRTYPTSRWEWFRREQLESWLPEAGVEYRWAPALGGRRSERQAREALAGPAPHAAATAGPAPPQEDGWRESGFAAYQWHMTTEEFFAAADGLVVLGRLRTLAIMCSELVWWRCHRSMIADYLVTAGAEVVHLQPRRLDHREVVSERLTRYAPAVSEAWRLHLDLVTGV